MVIWSFTIEMKIRRQRATTKTNIRKLVTLYHVLLTDDKSFVLSTNDLKWSKEGDRYEICPLLKITKWVLYNFQAA